MIKSNIFFFLQAGMSILYENEFYGGKTLVRLNRIL